MLRLCGLGVVLSLVAAAAAVMAMWLVDWWGPCPGLRLFVPEELARYRGGPGDPGLYLALLGRVYDVSSGRRHYEPGAHYSGFAGRDASRAFVTGDFSEAGLVDDVTGLSSSEILILQNWISFYEKNYVFVGRLVGRFYGEDGLPTPELTQVEALVAKGAEASEQQQREKHRFPPCNAEWSSAKGSRVWCSQKSLPEILLKENCCSGNSMAQRDPAPTWWLTTIHNSSSRGSDALFGLLQAPGTHMWRCEQRLDWCPQEAV
ncbi:neuferricin isoform X5 [Peromyscus californicus insignis]|uniref:neuferricin isoform X5 n=1 Tax=Peromyscus californicus insignis TaxID=564181 RepID=UPI0022A75F78|nr:neuferricin isoform X5 [Peromyscus californicus insignis]